MGTKRRIVRLKCSAQNYAWGHIGPQSAVGRLYALQSKQPIEEDKPYAELWMGTHDSCPSFVVLDRDNYYDDDDMDDVEDNIAVAKVLKPYVDCPDVETGAIAKQTGFGEGSASESLTPKQPEDGVDDMHGDLSHSTSQDNSDCCEQKTGSMLLKDWLSRNPELLGEKVLQRWGANLPFLFKVLSVAKALSIQAHPDKQLAKELHKLRPNIYKDDNHKPEMAFAITKFEALCGFVSIKELKHTLEIVPELQDMLGKSLSDSLMNLPALETSTALAKSTLKEAFTTIMTTNKERIGHALNQLCTRLKEATKERLLTKKELLAMRLANQYPGDVGVLSAFFFNYIQLDPGQALYLDANEPHAYLSGECLECMATSDNVVRAGLTPKYIDTSTLCGMLTYKQEMPEILSGFYVNKYTKRYCPPFDEFEMDSCIIPAGQTVEFPSIQGPSILIVLQGDSVLSELHNKAEITMFLQTGDIMFVPAETLFRVTVNSNANSEFHCYRAGVNSRVL